MIWIILLVVSIVIGVIGSRENEPSIQVWGITFSILTGIVLLFTFIIGILYYPSLIQAQAKIRTLQNNYDLVKKSYYKVKPGTFVGGSLDNNGLAKQLMSYSVELTEAKSYYNMNLASVKLYKTAVIFRWVGPGLFISNKILKLKKVK